MATTTWALYETSVEVIGLKYRFKNNEKVVVNILGGSYLQLNPTFIRASTVWFRNAPNSKRVQTNNLLNYFVSKPQGAELHKYPASSRH